jgi:ferritin
MLKERVEKALNEQITEEFTASQLYLAMASWAESNGLEGTANFLYAHSEEEREHALKLYHYINDRGGHAITPKLEQPEYNYDSIDKVFKDIMAHEKQVSEKINNLVGICLEEKDYTTNNFLQWYVEEQIEEENLFGNLLDKLEMLGDHKGKTYLFDNELGKSAAAHTAAE